MAIDKDSDIKLTPPGWIQLFHGAIKSTGALVSRMLAVLTVNKLFAIYFGAGGLTLLNHFQNLISLVTHIPDQGVNSGLLKYYAGEETSEATRQSLLGTAFWLNLWVCVLSALILYLGRGLFFEHFDIEVSYGLFFPLVIVGVLFILINTLFLTVLRAIQQFKAFAILTTLHAVVIVVFVWIGVHTEKFSIGLLAFILGHGIGVVFTVGYILFIRTIKVSKFHLDWGHVKKLSKFVIMAVSILVFGKLTDFLVRDYAIKVFGLEETGLWQCLVKISDYIRMLFIGAIGLVLYPQISACVHDLGALRRYIQSAYRLIIFCVVAGLMFVFLLKIPLITILFSSYFVKAGSMIHFQLIGDGFALLSFPLAYTLSAQAKVKAFIAVQALPSLFYIGFIAVFARHHSVDIMVKAHIVRYALFFVFLVLLNRKLIF